VSEVKYLGVNITADLSWSSQAASTAGKANSTLGFLRRNLKGCPAELKETAYISLVRSVLKYCATVWDPYLVKDRDELEKVQRRAGRFVKNNYQPKSSVTEMLNDLGWLPLAERRRELRLTLLFKILQGLVAVQTDMMVPSDTRTRHHNQSYKHISADTRNYANSFFPRTISDWNKLPADTINSQTPVAFKRSLRDLRRD